MLGENLTCVSVRPHGLRRALAASLSALLPATLCFGTLQGAKPEENNNALKRVSIVIHIKDHNGKSVESGSVKGLQVLEQELKLPVLDGPRILRPAQIALLIDCNFHQHKVLPLEQEVAMNLLSNLANEEAKALLISFASEIRSSGPLTNDWASLRSFTSSIQSETDKHRETVLLFDAMERALHTLGDEQGAKAVVIFAEGNDHGSSINWMSLARLAHRTHTAFYAVLFSDHSFYGPRSLRRYGWDLNELTPITGGELWEVGNNTRKSHDIAEQLFLSLTSQGLIDVSVPNHHTNGFHRVKALAPGYRISVQKGYFDREIH